MPPACASVRVSLHVLQRAVCVSPAGWMPSPLMGVKSETYRLMTLSHHEELEACTRWKCTHRQKYTCGAHRRMTFF